jgi:hypothetical protein
VCVDMFGEGFDLPELKIAAMHDVHKSLAITLQFTGRFSRSNPQIGNATMIASSVDPDMKEAIRDLYAKDADWNSLLPYLSEGETDRQVRRSVFLAGFVDAPVNVPLQNIFPKMSTVVYRTKCTMWRPENVSAAVAQERIFAGPTVQPQHRVMLFVTRERESIPWGDIKDIQNIIWDLYLLHWDADKQLLFINSSNNDSLYSELAKAIAGDDVELIRGEPVFRCLHDIKRLILMNLGLNYSLSRAVRFTMYVGADIREGLSQAHYENKFKSNLFGRGFEAGEKATMGCSYKGRIWSYKIARNIQEWIDWCHGVGKKLLDESISFDEILKHVIIPDLITERPPLVPLAIEWSEDFLSRSEDTLHLDIGGETVPFFEAGMELVDNNREGPLRFRVFTETKSIEYEVRFFGNTVDYLPTGPDSVDILVSRNNRRSLSDWFQKEPPIIHFENGGLLIYNSFARLLSEGRAPFDRERIDVWDWSGVDPKKESQTIAKYPDSIQYRVFQELLHPSHNPRYEIVYDDDDANEAADAVAIRVAGDHLIVHFFHCKYSSARDPGARVEDLYAVCGQAQRSVFWKGNTEKLLKHLRYREERRLEKHNVSRFQRGDLDVLDEIARVASQLIPEFKITIVQPGLSKAKALATHLELLAATELYLQEAFAIELGVIASA